MAHREHNRGRQRGGFALIILGALLLFLAPTVYDPAAPSMGVAALAGGFVLGGMGFYIHFIRYRNRL